MSVKHYHKLPYRIETRVDEAKYQELQGLLKSSRYRNMSELLRDLIYDKKIILVTHDNSLDLVMQQLSATHAELHAIGVNINQVTRYFNAVKDAATKTYHALNIAGQYRAVGEKVDILFTLISKLSVRWLQK